MEHYDFILFENYQLATHHLYDVVLIGKLLKRQGFKVGVFDLYDQFKEDGTEGIPLIKWHPSHQIPQIEWMQRKHSRFESLYKAFLFTKHRNAYLREAKAFIRERADNFYCGSLYNGMPTLFFDLDKPCYWWGLRSSRMRFHWKELFKTPKIAVCKLLELSHFRNNPCQRLFVSNAIILDEFVKLGIDRNRITIREERCIEKIGPSNLERMTHNTSFLVIGMLRPEKHIPLTVSAFKRSCIPNATLYLTGRSSTGYETTIESAVEGDPRVIRTNRFLNYEDFNTSFQQSHFVLFADEEGESCITNGTLTEALINHRPVICPDCQPYKYYIKKYGVGLTYEVGNVDSYASAMQKASKLGVSYFKENIDRFLETILVDKVAKELETGIRHNGEG